MGFSIEGIKYQCNRFLGNTAYDQHERSANDNKNGGNDDFTQTQPEKRFSKHLVRSLEVNVVSDLPTPAGARMTILIYAIVAALFVYLAVDSYGDNLREKFLALSQDEGVCTEIPKDVSGVYYADSDGNWEGDDEFAFSKSLYSFQFFGLATSEDKFYQVIDTCLGYLDAKSEIMRKENFAITVLYWTTWVLNSADIDPSTLVDGHPFLEGSNSQFFSLTGHIGTVMNQAASHRASVSNANGHCNITAVAKFDKIAASFRVTYTDAAAYVNSAACMDMLNIMNLGYNPRLPTPQFDILFDITTVMACVSVNLGIVALDSLEVVPFSNGLLYTKFADSEELVEVAYARYFHPRFPNMDTMYCLTDPIGGEVYSCGIYKNTFNLLPVFNHLGYFEAMSVGDLGYCVCDDTYSSDVLDQCNAYSFVTGFIFYNFHEDPENGNPYAGRIESDQNYLDLLYKYKSRLPDLNRDAFNASKVASFHSFTPESGLEYIYDFCTEGMTKSCSLLTITSTSDGEVTSMTDNYYQVPWGHCNVTTAISNAARQKLYTPPARLTEAYYECKKNKFDSLVSSIGLSSATALSFKVMVILFVSIVLSKKSPTVNKKTGKFKTYGIEDRNEALHFLSFNLLLARDAKYRKANKNDDADKSIVQSLADEMSTTNFIKRFFPKPTSSSMLNGNNNGSEYAENPLHQSAEKRIELSGSGNESLTVAKMVHHRKQAAFQEELLTNPFFRRSKKS